MTPSEQSFERYAGQVGKPERLCTKSRDWGVVMDEEETPSPRRGPYCGRGMMLADRYGLPLSTSSSARDAYVEGCDLVLTAYPGAVSAFDRAIADDPGFVLAHACRARALQIAA